MAGFFGFFDYSKPGKGVDANEPPKHAFFQFFELYFRKFFRLITLNFLYFVALLPIITYCYMMVYGFLMNYIPADMMEQYTGWLLASFLVSVVQSLPPVLCYVLLAASALFYGPIACGYTYMLRNFVRQEHAWTSDFFAKAKQNFKQGVFFGLLDILVFVLFFFNLSFFRNLGPEDTGLMFDISRYITMAVMVFYLFMRNYIFMMVVTFELKIRQILKNAFYFSVLGLWRNILIAVLCAAVFILSTMIHPLAELVVMPLLTFSLTGFITVFIAYPVIKKYMLDPMNEKREPAALE